MVLEMGCGLNENVKAYIGISNTDALKTICTNSLFHLSREGKRSIITVHALGRISELFQFFNNPEIQVLRCDRMAIPCSVPFLMLPGLKELSVGGVLMTSSFKAVDLVRELSNEFSHDCSRLEQFLNEIYGLNPYFKDQRIVHRTNLSECPLSSFYFLSYFPVIRSLSVCNTPFSNQDALTIDCFLTSLNAQSTRINSLSCFQKFLFLQNLNLSYCNLSCYNLTAFSQQRIQYIEPDANVFVFDPRYKTLRSFSQLQVLNLTNCYLRTLNFLIYFPNLRRFYLDSNKDIDDFAPIFALKKLKFLSCMDCGKLQIGGETAWNAEQSGLQMVLLKGSVVDADFFKQIRNAERLEISQHCLPQFELQMMQMCALQDLFLYGVSPAQVKRLRDTLVDVKIDYLEFFE